MLCSCSAFVEKMLEIVGYIMSEILHAAYLILYYAHFVKLECNTLL